MKRTIFVIGLGLIGGSLAKCLAQSTDNHVIGFDINDQTVKYAHMHGIIDEIASNIQDASKRSDYIFLATPITQTIQLLHELDSFTYDQNVVISDVSSVKTSVIHVAESLSNQRIAFIGGHPMAGSHKKGIQAAKEHLFENAIYVLTPGSKCEERTVEVLKDVLKPTKSNFITLKPTEHDEMTAVVSHFPHLIASSLVHQAKKWEHTHDYIPKLAAGGFRDITRIASSNPDLWQDIFYHNRVKMSQLLQEWIDQMKDIKNLLERNDKTQLTSYLNQAKEYRDGLGEKKRGAIPSFYDLYVDIRDQTGAIASVAQLLATKDISITNIEILEIRQGITGVLRLSVASQEEQQESYHLLRENGYEIMIEQ
ncbi:prephenate dehydrogenase [Virgibacillus byunsanensis]|uniref:Prephenate dehydrogenase n=1 Tax=Virgibacillus byunsanensis TaxID=570945 RepID=A0ABW3LKY3_9BACI